MLSPPKKSSLRCPKKLCHVNKLIIQQILIGNLCDTMENESSENMALLEL